MDFTSNRSFELRLNIPKFTKAMLLRLLYLPVQTDSNCLGNSHSHLEFVSGMHTDTEI